MVLGGLSFTEGQTQSSSLDFTRVLISIVPELYCSEAVVKCVAQQRAYLATVSSKVHRSGQNKESMWQMVPIPVCVVQFTLGSNV